MQPLSPGWRDGRRGILAVLALLAVVFVLASVSAGAMMRVGPGPGMMAGWGPGMMWGWGYGAGGAAGDAGAWWPWALAMGLHMVLTVAFWGLLLVGGVMAVRALTGSAPRSTGGGGESALEIAQRRYAGGEISREQYEELRRTLVQP